MGSDNENLPRIPLEKARNQSLTSAMSWPLSPCLDSNRDLSREPTVQPSSHSMLPSPLFTSAEKESESQNRKNSYCKTNGGDSFDDEVTSRLKISGTRIKRQGAMQTKEGTKRIASSLENSQNSNTRSFGSGSEDIYMERMDFQGVMLEKPRHRRTPQPHGQISNTQSHGFNLVLGKFEFNGIHLNKIMASDKLSELALSDPKRVKRILANRESAARSKIRKARYMVELEHKVQSLQAKASMVSAQLVQLERDSDRLSGHQNELKLRLEALEQHSHLQKVLNEIMIGDLKRLKASLSGASGTSQHGESVSTLEHCEWEE